ncbi:MAG TPA: LLM class flavin-dependent oxidoreductase [Gaiellales bacterium]
MDQLGLGLQGDKPLADYGELATMAEDAGFATVCLFNDLWFQPPLPALLEIARATSRVRLGPVCLNPFTLHPVEIAGQIAALDDASDGRAYLGIASGAWLGEIGLSQDGPRTAVREACEVVRRLLAGDDSGFAGERFSLPAGRALRYPRTRSSVPLLIGAWRPGLVALAGEIADELKIGGCTNPEMIAVARERLAAGAGPAGRSPDDVGIVLGGVTVVDEDGARARALIRHELLLYLPVVGPLDPTSGIDPELFARLDELTEEGRRDEAAALIPDAVVDRFSFAGTPRQVAAQARELLDAGARRVEFGPPHGLDERAGVRLLAEQVAPSVLRSA